MDYWKKTKLNVVLQRLYILGAPKAGFIKVVLISCTPNQPNKIELIGVRDNVVYTISISRILSTYQSSFLEGADGLCDPPVSQRRCFYLR